NRAAGFLEVPPGGELISTLAGGFALRLADDADVLSSIAQARLILQLHGQLARFLVPRSRLDGPTSFMFGHTEEIVGPHHLALIARLPKAFERLLVKAGSALKLIAIAGEGS